MVQEFYYENKDNVEMSYTFEYNESFTDTFSFGFKESIKAGIKTNVEADVMVFKGKAEISAEVGLEAN
jgi:hypothetical protein